MLILFITYMLVNTISLFRRIVFFCLIIGNVEFSYKESTDNPIVEGSAASLFIPYDSRIYVVRELILPSVKADR